MFALRVIKLVDALPRDTAAKTLGHQLLRSATSVAANYRASVRAKSPADFVSQMGTVEEECGESMLGMKLLIESGRMKPDRLADLMREGGEILAITVASIKTARRGK